VNEYPFIDINWKFESERTLAAIVVRSDYFYKYWYTNRLVVVAK